MLGEALLTHVHERVDRPATAHGRLEPDVFRVVEHEHANTVDAEPLEALVHTREHLVVSELAGVLVSVKLGLHNELATKVRSGQSGTDDLLRASTAVDVRGVDEIDSVGRRGGEHRNRLSRRDVVPTGGADTQRRNGNPRSSVASELLG